MTKTGRMTMMISRKMKNLIKKLGLKPKKLKIILKIKKQKRKKTKTKKKTRHLNQIQIIKLIRKCKHQTTRKQFRKIFKKMKSMIWRMKTRNKRMKSRTRKVSQDIT